MTVPEPVVFVAEGGGAADEAGVLVPVLQLHRVSPASLRPARKLEVELLLDLMLLLTKFTSMFLLRTPV